MTFDELSHELDMINAEVELQKLKDKVIKVLDADTKLKEAKRRHKKAVECRRFGNRPALAENVTLAEQEFQQTVNELHKA